MCIEVYELDPAHFLSAAGLAWHAWIELELVTNIAMSLLIEKRIAIHRYVEANNKCVVYYDKNKELKYIL